MNNTKELLKSVERKITGSYRSNLFSNALWVSGENEANYFLKGHATELLDATYLPRRTNTEAIAKIYGIVANNQEGGRYVWVYLFYEHHIWRCHSIKNAYEVIEKIRQHNELEKKATKLQNKINYQNRNEAIVLN